MSAVPAKFGTPLGVAPGNVPVYSSHYPSADQVEFPDRESYRSYLDGVFMGYKWQCVEFARRWLYLNKGYIFDDIAMAYDIFELRNVRQIKDNRLLPLYAFKNGSARRPEAGSLLIWSEGGEFEETGHVAVITEVLPSAIRIAEQNLDHLPWPEGQDYSRELPLSINDQGGHWINCSYPDVSILGWVVQTTDDTHAEPRVDHAPALFNLQMREMPAARAQHSRWLDLAQAEEEAYVEMMGGPWLTKSVADQRTYFCLSETAAKEIKHAANELHAMYMHATHRVLRDDKLLQHFNLPRSIWPKLRQSWNNRRNEMITGRFDFSVSERGIKVYEYNADSASCYLEAGKLQGRWFESYGYDEGRCPGKSLHRDLVRAWRKSGVDSLLHIMQDDDLEESYHALYMKTAVEAAGIRCKVIKGMSGLAWDRDGFVVDADGERILWVWKTWAWETALDQLRAECDEDELLAKIGSVRPSGAQPRLVDVLLRPEVMVYEPLWTLVPSNKAILPVLWELFPDHPYLLNAAYALNDTLTEKGYVTKPIAGRCGFNISIVDKHQDLIEETGGRFGDQEMIYQQLFKLPKLGALNVQVGAFSVDGHYSASCVRVDPSPVITTYSDLLPLRILADREFLQES